jgi:hypothetical protein
VSHYSTDLELYASLAKDFARRGRHQILGIFIRDVTPQSDILDPNRHQFSSRPPSPASSIHEGSSQIPSIDSVSSSSYFSPNPPRNTPMDQSRRPSHETEEPEYLSHADEKNVYPVFSVPQDRDLTIHPSHQQQPPPHRAVSFPLQNPRSLQRDPEALTDTQIRSLTPPIVESPTRKGMAGTSSSTEPPLSFRSTPEKRRVELKMRIARARNEIPPGVMFKVFQNPEECFSEVEDLLSKHGVGPPDPHSTGGFWHDVDAS